MGSLVDIADDFPSLFMPEFCCVDEPAECYSIVMGYTIAFGKEDGHEEGGIGGAIHGGIADISYSLSGILRLDLHEVVGQIELCMAVSAFGRYCVPAAGQFNIRGNAQSMSIAGSEGCGCSDIAIICCGLQPFEGLFLIFSDVFSHQ